MRILTNICSDDLQESKTFYVNLLDLQVKYDRGFELTFSDIQADDSVGSAHWDTQFRDRNGNKLIYP